MTPSVPPKLMLEATIHYTILHDVCGVPHPEAIKRAVDSVAARVAEAGK